MLRHIVGKLGSSAALRVNALVLVRTSALLDQWHKSLSQFITIADALSEQPKKRGRPKAQSAIGRLGAGKSNLTGRVDIATMQSQLDGDSVKDLVKDYGLVIVDECHHVSAFGFEMIPRLPTRDMYAD